MHIIKTYKLLGENHYFKDDQETIISLKFSSNSVLVFNYDLRHEVNLNEILIQYSFEVEGEFYTIDNKKFNTSYNNKKLTNLNTSLTYKMKLTNNTMSKFGYNIYISTSNILNLIFIIVVMDIKCIINHFIINALNRVLIYLINQGNIENFI